MPVQNRIFRQTEWDKPWIYLQLFRKIMATSQIR